MLTPAGKREAIARLRCAFRHERAAGVQDDRLCADDGGIDRYRLRARRAKRE